MIDGEYDNLIFLSFKPSIVFYFGKVVSKFREKIPSKKTSLEKKLDIVKIMFVIDFFFEKNISF